LGAFDLHESGDRVGAFRRTVFFLTLLTFLAGCSGYERVNLPGELSAISQESLTLSKPSNFGLKKITIAFAEIEKVEMAQSNGVIDALTIVVGIVMIGYVALAFGFRNADLS
jgi:hypothetical protein